jgi:hypothetical protein
VSPPDSTNPSKSGLARIDVYTVMLAIALLAIVLAVVLLSMELGRYNWDIKAQSAPRAAAVGRAFPTLVITDVTRESQTS